MPNDHIVSQLEAALALTDVPEAARKSGQVLYENLSRPVRVALIGPEEAGKSSLANLLIGERLLPPGTSARVIEIVPGSDFMAEAEYEDGRLEAPDREELESVTGAERLQIASASEILNRIALVETRTNDLDTLREVVKSADILLWCTPVFGQSERVIWHRVGDAHRDHAFLILTKADKLARKNRLAEAIASLQEVAKADFAGFYPVATLQGLKSLDTKPKDKNLWNGSGAKALVRAVLEHAERGRQADLDQAELFLARYTYEVEEVDEVSGRRTSRIRSRQKSQMQRRRSRATRQRQSEELDIDDVVETSEAPAGPRPWPRLDTSDTAPARPATRQLAEAEAEPPAPERAAATAVAEVAPPVATAPPAPSAPARRTPSLANRLDQVRTTTSRPHPAPSRPDISPGEPVSLRPGAPPQPGLAQRTLETLRATGEKLTGCADDPGRILGLCAETADALRSMFDEADVPADLDMLSEDIVRTTEMMMLLQIENAPGPAAEAVTILLQLKRDFEQLEAA